MKDIESYNQRQDGAYKDICELLEKIITQGLSNTTAKVWHGHPVWFIEENPTVGYSVQKSGVRLMFWSGRSFKEPDLTGKSRFKDASVFYNDPTEIDTEKLTRWLKKAESIQWDYKNIIKRKGVLEKLGNWK
jgi:hypothetical protein